MQERVIGRLIGLLAGVVLMALLVGCGGGSSSSAVGQAEFVVNWPQPTRLIPTATKSIVVDIKNGTQQIARKLLVQPQVNAPSTVSFNSLPVGNLTAIATAYPKIDGTGTPLAQASTPLLIQAQKTTQFTIIMQSTITRLDLSPLNPSVAGGQTVLLTATPKDASDRVVMVAPGKLQWASSNPAVASVLPDRGNVSGLTVGTAQITVTEIESGKTATTTVTVTSNAGNPGGLAASGWPKAQADARNTGRALGGGAVGTLKWRNGPYSNGVGNLVLGPGGSIHGTSGYGDVYKIDAATGAVIWQKVGSSGTGSSYPAVAADGTVYVMQSLDTGSTDCYAFNGTSGGIKWRTTINGALDPHTYVSTSPAIAADGTVYMSNIVGTYALDPTTGAVKWQYVVPPGLSAGFVGMRPAIAQDGTIIVNGGFVLYALDPATGAEKWIFPNYEFGPPSIGDDGTVYVRTLNTVFAIDGATGAQKWQVPFTDNVSVTRNVPPGIALGRDGTLYTMGARSVYALNPANGAQKWAYLLPFVPHSEYDEFRTTPAVGSDGTIYVGANKVYALDPANGTEKWEYGFSPTFGRVGSPAIAPDGTIYVSGNLLDPSVPASGSYIYAVR